MRRLTVAFAIAAVAMLFMLSPPSTAANQKSLAAAGSMGFHLIATTWDNIRQSGTTAAGALTNDFVGAALADISITAATPATGSLDRSSRFANGLTTSSNSCTSSPMTGLAGASKPDATGAAATTCPARLSYIGDKRGPEPTESSVRADNHFGFIATGTSGLTAGSS